MRYSVFRGLFYSVLEHILLLDQQKNSSIRIAVEKTRRKLDPLNFSDLILSLLKSSHMMNYSLKLVGLPMGAMIQTRIIQRAIGSAEKYENILDL